VPGLWITKTRKAVLDSFILLIVRLIPAAMQLVLLLGLSRWLPPTEFGIYALSISSVIIINAIFFNMWRSSIARFVPAQKEVHHIFIKRIVAGISISFCLVIIAALIAFSAVPEIRDMVAVLIFALAGHATVDLCIEYIWCRNNLRQYAVCVLWRAGSLFVCVGAAAFYSNSAEFSLTAYAVSQCLAAILFLVVISRSPGTTTGAYEVRISDFVHYGWPLALTTTLTLMMGFVDRFMIARFLGNQAVGYYVLPAELTLGGITLVGLAVYLNLYLPIVRAAEEGDAQAVQENYSLAGIVFCGIVFPSATGFAILAPLIAPVIISEEYQKDAIVLIPIFCFIAVAVAAQSSLVNIVLQIMKRTNWLPVITLIAGGTNILLNFIWIPQFGLVGAASATATSQILCAVLVTFAGSRTSDLRLPWLEMAKITGACLGTTLVVLPLRQYFDGVTGILVLTVIGIVAYVATLFLLKSTLAVRK